MADIKQAAKWLQEGSLVRRPRFSREISLGFSGWIMIYEYGKRARDGRIAPFDMDDLLATDWEKAA